MSENSPIFDFTVYYLIRNQTLKLHGNLQISVQLKNTNPEINAQYDINQLCI